MITIIQEAKRLYDLGFAIIVLHPKSKRPVESGWTTGERTPWKQIEATLSLKHNIGVRTGSASRVGSGYLACIDVDIKDPKYSKEALAKLRQLTGSRLLPEVRSGSGNGSRHLYCVTSEPFKMITFAKHEGWEICIYSQGRQMVLPPSIHPDTDKPYVWVNQIGSAFELPLMDFSSIESVTKPRAKALKDKDSEFDQEMFYFQEHDVDLAWLPMSDQVREAIITGTGVKDRSGYLLPAATALHSAGLNESEILSVLTDPNTFMGKCAYDHAKTTSRARAAHWLHKYTLRKIMSERSPVVAFENQPVVASKKLTKEEAAKQSEEIESEWDWKQDLVRGGKEGKGTPISSIGNVVLILSKMISPEIFKRNEFALRDSYGCATPWGSKIGERLGDDDVPRIIYWLGQNFHFEPSRDVIYSAMTVIACRNAYDPVKEQLEQLKPWDGTPRLHTWLRDHFEAEGDADYLSQVFTKWLVAMVRRVYQPGAKFDWMPIFEGPQGAGKSSFGRLLVGEEYFLDWLPNLADKDSALGLQGHWAVEMGELSQFRKNELETIKAFITRTVDKFRPPHGRKLLESPRRCVFFGTTNRETYLIDDSGNRRFKPVKVGRLDFETLRRERAQLFAEAKFLFETKINQDLDFELTNEARVFEAIIHQQKMIEDDSSVMLELMQNFVEKVTKDEAVFNLKKFQISDLFGGIGPLGGATPRWHLNMKNTILAGKMLKKLGGEKRKIRGRYYWKLPEGESFSPKGSPHDFY